MPDKIAKFLQGLNAKTRKQLKLKMSQLRENPFAMPGVKKMQTGEGVYYRLRVGKIRIIYVVSNIGVEIIDIDYRGNIYQ